MTGSREKKERNWKKTVIMLCLLLAGLNAGIFLSARAHTIDLNQYLTISVSGYQGVGQASYQFDSQRFAADYKNKLKFQKAGQVTAIEALAGKSDRAADAYAKSVGGSVADYVASQIGGDFDKRDLSNGDRVTYHWNDAARQLASHLNYRILYADVPTEVSGLKKITSFDAFQFLRISYDGAAGRASLNMDWNGLPKGLYFSADRELGLDNGDKITVTLEAPGGDAPAYCAKTLGEAPSRTYKTYTVKNLRAYPKTFSQLPEAAVKKMKKKAETQIRRVEITTFDEEISGMSYLGHYFIRAGKSGQKNSTVLFYRVTASFSGQSESKPSVTFYVPVRFGTILIGGADGWSADLNKITLPRHKVYTDVHYYPGYASLAEAEKAVTASLETGARVEKNVSE